MNKDLTCQHCGKNMLTIKSMMNTMFERLGVKHRKVDRYSPPSKDDIYAVYEGVKKLTDMKSQLIELRDSCKETKGLISPTYIAESLTEILGEEG